MRSWTENFGKFYTNASNWDSRKEIFIEYNNETTGEDMVIMAIRLAKMYNCRIVEKVHFTSDLVRGKVSFTVECHSLTYRYFYDDGKTCHLHCSEVTEKDLQKYEQMFGTRSCEDQCFEKKFWFTDNWNGNILEYSTLRKAKAEAKKQTGNSCCIYETFPYGRPSQIVCFAPASGITRP